MRLTDLQKIDVVEKYKNGLNSTQIAKFYNINSSAVLGLLHRRNVVVRTIDRYHRKYFFNDTVFDKIDSEEKAYWLGFLLGDGSVDKRSLKLELGKIDVNHVIKFKYFIGDSSPVRYTAKNCVIGAVNSKKFCCKIAKYGLIPNKTTVVKTPKINNYLLPHFYRGILESDGWICKHVSDSNKDQHEFGFSSANMDFLKEIKVWIEKIIKFECGYLVRRSKGKQSCCQLIIGGNKNFVKLYNLFYKEANVYLTRKYDTATSFYKELLTIN